MPVVLVACRGTVGAVHLTSGRIYANGNAMAIDHLDASRVDPSYLSHYLTYRGFRDVVSGSSQPQITRSNLNRVEVPLPPLTEQSRIVAMLDAASDLLEKALAAESAVESLFDALYRDLMLKRDRSWEIRALSSLVDKADRLNYGVVQPGPHVDHGVPLVRVGNLRGGRIDRSNIKLIAQETEAGYLRSRLRGDEILISCVGTIGVVALASGQDKGSNVARAVARVPVRGAANRRFVAAVLGSRELQRFFTSELRTSSQPTLNIKQIGEALIPLPPRDIQDDFESELLKVDRALAFYRARSTRLSELVGSVQARAFHGPL